MKNIIEYMLLFVFIAACSSGNEKTSLGREQKTQPLLTGKQYIDNGKIRLGVDMDRGGSVFYFAKSSNKQNILNHCDEGRFIQQSYYGEGDSSFWSGKPWVWNPVQGGGCNGTKARVKSNYFEANYIHVISEPVHWAKSIHMPELEMEEIITLDDNTAHIHYIFKNNGEKATDHPRTSHELPAVFIDAAYQNLVFYKGDKPWDKDTLTRVVPGWPNEFYNRTEEWSAFVNDDNYGVGVYTPGTADITAYRFEGPTGPDGGGCSYFAPVRSFAIHKGDTCEYDVFVFIGTIEEIRDEFYKIRNKNYSNNN